MHNNISFWYLDLSYILLICLHPKNNFEGAAQIIQGANLKKESGLTEPKNFLGLETNPDS